MSEYLNQPDKKPQAVHTGMSIEEWAASQTGQKPVEQQRAPQVPPHRRYDVQPAPSPAPAVPRHPRPTEALLIPEAVKPKRRLSRRTTAAIIVSAVLVTGGIAAAKHDTISTAVDSMTGDDGLKNIIGEAKPVTQSSFSIENCTDPENTLMVATVNAELPLIPMLPSEKDPKTAVASKPYLTEKNASGMTSEQKKIFSPFVNDEGYMQAEAVNLPLALTVCIPDKSKAITRQNGEYTIDFTQMDVKFQDPTMLLQEDLPVARQEDSPTDIDLKEPEEYYLSVPAEWHNLFLDTKTGDKLHDEAAKKLIDSYVTPAQLQLMLADIVTQVTNEANTSVDGENGISFPGSEKSLQDSVAKSIVERITGKTAEAPNTIGTLKVSPAVPLNASKKPITHTDAKTGASPFIYLDPSAEVTIKDMTIKTGTMKPKETNVKASSDK